MDDNWSSMCNAGKQPRVHEAIEAMNGAVIGLLVLGAGVIVCALLMLLRSATKKASVVPLASSMAAELGLAFAWVYLAAWNIWDMHATEYASAHNLRFILCLVFVSKTLMIFRPVGLFVYASVQTFQVFKRKDVGFSFALAATGFGALAVVGLAVPAALGLTVGDQEICPGKTIASVIPASIGEAWVFKYDSVLLLVSYVLTLVVLVFLSGFWLFFHLSSRGGDRGETKSLMGKEEGKALSTYACPAICLVAIVRSILDIGFVSSGLIGFRGSDISATLFLPGTACAVLLAFMICKK